MAHLGMGTMFGMTILGDPQTFLHHQKTPVQGTLKDACKKRLLKLFVEKGHFHHNINEVRRAVLPQIFTDAMGRQLDQNEIDLMLRHFPIQPGNMTYEEFETAIDDMKASDFVHSPPYITKGIKSLKAPTRPKTLNSEIEYMKVKHKRDVLGPTDVTTKPMTTNMEYGWETMLYPGESSIPNERRKFYYPKNGTDVTQARGIEVKNKVFLEKKGGSSQSDCSSGLSYNGRNNSYGAGLRTSRPTTAFWQARTQMGFIDIHRRPSTSTSSVQQRSSVKLLRIGRRISAHPPSMGNYQR